ncbi:MAG: lamin tail domain-containing protein [Flavobacteriales bacterium]|nr:lamin tail domain-containing protein [Flavobacteriales bacterium]
MRKTYTFLLMVFIITLSYGQNVGDVIITEIMQNPSGADSGKEWFEIFNTTSFEINLKNYKIKYGSTSISNHKINSDLIVPSNGYVVLGNNSDESTNGGIHIEYIHVKSIQLGNTSYTLGIISSDGSTLIDEVVWDNGATFPDPSGASMSLKTTAMTSTSNDDGANWMIATTPYGDGDLGTPGAQNDQALSININEVSELSIYPNPVSFGSFVLTTSSMGTKEVSIYNVLGSQVFRQNFNSSKLEVNISNFDSGMYFVRVVEGKNISVNKLVIQ